MDANHRRIERELAAERGHARNTNMSRGVEEPHSDRDLEAHCQ
jgi:hypothetical protein